MATIASLTPIASIAGSEEFVINAAGLDRKCTATQITATVTANLTSEIATRTSEVATLTSGKLNLAGGTMTGTLVLAGAPVANLQAATKLYVDTAVTGVASLASPTLTGSPTAPTATASATSGSTQVATTNYVGDAITEQTSLKKTALAAAALTLTTAHKGTIEVDYSATGTTNITLPVISSLTGPEDYEYYIVDTGNNAGTNTITITAGAGNTVTGAATTTITTDGASLLLANSGGTAWYAKDADADASATVKGLVEMATTVEASALTDSTRAVTAAGIGAAFDAFPYNITQLGAASHVLTEADTGTLYITRTLTGTCSIQLPNPAGLTSAARTQYAIYDAGAASTNNATITTAGGNIDGGSSFVIDNTRMGATFITDGTNWVSIANTNTAFSGGAATPWQDTGVDIYFPQAATIGSSVAPTSTLQLDKTSGDVAITFSQAGAAKFAVGIDDTAGENLKISRGGTLGTNDIIDIDSADSTIGIGNVPQPSHLVRIDGDSSSASRMLHIEQTATATASYAVEVNLDGTAAGHHKFGYRTRIDGGGVGNDGICIAIEKGAYTVDVASADIVFHGELGSTTRKNYGAYLLATSSNAQDNTGIYMNVANAGAGNAYALDIAAGDIKLDTGTGSKIGTATTQKLGFWNVTPVVQPSSVGETTGHAAVGGTNVNASDTFTGNSGTKAYTINDVVKHLKAAGILAGS